MPSVGRHYVSTLAANGAILLLGVVSGMLAARLLGPSGRGELAIVTLWPMALGILGNLGMNQAVAFFTAQQPERRNGLFTAAMVIGAAQGVLFAGLGYFLLPLLLGGHEASVLQLARWFLLFIPLSFLSGYLLNLLQGAMHLNAYNLSRMLGAAWYTLVVVALFLSDRADIGTIVTWQLAGYGVNGLLNFWLVRRLLGVHWQWDASVVRPVLSYGAKTQLGGVTYYLNQRLDQLVMSVWLEPQALGYYVVAVALASPLTIIPTAIGIVTLPAAARETAVAAQAVIRRSVRTVLLLCVGSALALFLLVPYLLPLFFGEAFRPAIGACRVLVLAMIPLSLSLVLYESLRALNHPLGQAYAEVTGNLVTILLLVWLLPRYGFLGAAYASLGAYAASLLAAVWYSRTRAGLSLRQLLSGAV